MAKLINASTSSLEEVPEDQVPNVLAAGSHGFAAGQMVNFINPDDGESYSAPAQYTQAILGTGARLETAADIQGRRDKAEFGDRPIAAGLAGAARSFTFGFSDYLGAKLGIGEPLRKLKDYNEGASLVGEVGGVGAGLFVPGPNLIRGAGLVGEGISHAVAPIAERVIGEGAEQGIKSAAQRITGQAIAKGAGSAAEGALYGVGQTISEASLGNVENNGELLASNIGISALMGGAIGAAIPVAGGVLKGLNKLRPGTTGIGEDGFAVTDAANKLYAKAATLFGANEQEYLRVLRDPALRDRAFAMTEEGVTQKIKDVGTGLSKAAKEISGEGYSLLDDAVIRKAGELGESGELNTFAVDLHNEARSLVNGAKTEIEKFKKSYNSQTRDAVERAEEALNGNVPKLAEDWNALRGKVLDEHPDFHFANRMGGVSPEGEGAFSYLPKNASPELQSEFAKVQIKTVNRAKQEIQETTGTGKYSIEGTATDKRLLTTLKDSLDDVITNIPGVGDVFKEANSAYRSFKSDFKNLAKNMFDAEGNLDAQKAINFVKAGGAKGEKVDDIIARAENYISKIENLHSGSADEAVLGKVKALKDSFEELKTLRDAGSDLRSIESLKSIAGPSGSGIGTIANALGVISGKVNPAAGALIAPATSPYFYVKGLNTLDKTLNQQVNLSRLGRLERVLGQENKTLADVAASSIRTLANATKIPAVLTVAKNTEQTFKQRQALLQQMQTVEPEHLYESIHNIVGNPAPAHAIATTAVANRALDYLVSKMPAPPLQPAASIAFDKKVALPSKTEMQSFNAVYDAVENPKVVLESLGAGTLKIEQVEALRVVYPQLYSQVGEAITTYLQGHPGEVPFQSRLRLGTWFGQATTKELSPEYILTSQAAFMHQGSGEDSSTPQQGSPAVGKVTIGQRTLTPTQATMTGRKA